MKNDEEVKRKGEVKRRLKITELRVEEAERQAKKKRNEVAKMTEALDIEISCLGNIKKAIRAAIELYQTGKEKS